MRRFFYLYPMLFSVLIVCAGLSLSVQADVYKWTDKKGVTHFSDQPPPSGAGALELQRQPEAPPSTWRPSVKPSGRSSAHSAAETPPPEAEKPKRPVKVELYETSWCHYCKKAKAYLRANRIAFTAYDVEKDAEAAKRRKSLDKRGGVPLAVINGKIILGFSEAAYRKALSSVE